MADSLRIQGARENNLKNIDLTIPRDKLIVFTGLSGSGKSSLAFDTIYAEGQRRYVESLSSYARQFLGQMEKPDVDNIEGLSPAISIDQKTTGKNPRSTVGTVTEIYDYLRLLYARIGIPHCPQCGKPITRQTVDQMIDQILAWPQGTKFMVLSPVVRARKGEYVKLFRDLAAQGFVRVRVDGTIHRLDEAIPLAKTKKHDIDIVVDRLVVKEGVHSRLTGSLETALEHGEGIARLVRLDDESEHLFSQHYACVDCGVSIEELTPRAFSFNSPYGACPTCVGLGTLTNMDADLVIPDKTLSLNQGALQCSGWHSDSDESMAAMYLNGLAAHYGFSLDLPVGQLPKEILDIILYGSGQQRIRFEYSKEYGNGSFQAKFEGVLNNLERRYRETSSNAIKDSLEQYQSSHVCPDCRGERLKPEVLCVKVGDLSIAQLCRLSIVQTIAFFQALTLTPKHAAIAQQILLELSSRLGFLMNVGLGYLTLSRGAATLSGGESQRIRLATQIGSKLVGVLYILDEPSIGLHQRDNAKLLATLKSLRDLGNTLIVVEHDEDTMRAADYIVDIGPGPGEAGGEIVAAGTPQEVMACPTSLTGQYLSGAKTIPLPERRTPPGDAWLTVRGATENNLKDIDVAFPLGLWTCVTGVSGSGKSSLVGRVVNDTLRRDLNRAKTLPGACRAIEGIDQLDKVIDIDQSPIGRTPRSNPATYTGVFDIIRDLFAQTNDAHLRGYSKGRFSFNVKGGRCEACRGDGILKIEMHFLPDVYVPCEVCKGKRYNRETLEVRYKGSNIHDVLEMTAQHAVDFFANMPKIKNKLQMLCDVGLGYIRLGQPSTTLSGGEAQRIKLATELCRRPTGRTLYILDEPTTGLHTHDVARLISILQRLQSTGNTILVIEHNLDMIKSADYVVDLGPEGGDLGGTLVAAGTPEQVALCADSYTGQYLQRMLP